VKKTEALLKIEEEIFIRKTYNKLTKKAIEVLIVFCMVVNLFVGKGVDNNKSSLKLIIGKVRQEEVIEVKNLGIGLEKMPRFLFFKENK
jgi:predicted transcriptional regulator